MTTISPGMMRIFDRLTDTPAEIVTELGETPRQTPIGVALVGDLCRYTGFVAQHRLPVVHRSGKSARSDPPEDHEFYYAALRFRARGRCWRCAGPGPGPLGSPTRSPPRAGSSGPWDRHARSVSGREKSSATGILRWAAWNCTARFLLDPEQSHSLLVLHRGTGQ